MKKIVLLSLVLVFVFASTSLYAAEKYALGMGNIALKVDYLSFSEDVFDDLDLKDGVYVGLEGYYAVMPNLYLGMETGWAGTSEDATINILGDNYDAEADITLIPVELNLKYAFEVSPAVVIDIGAGVSYNYFKVDLEVGDEDANEDSWVFGGQVFADLNYKLSNQWFIGINAKYQITDDLEFELRDQDVETDTSADNFRVGAQIGYMF
jgi:opacity protein-like surface antigen